MPEPCPIVTIFSRPDCHLCDIAKLRVESAARVAGFEVAVVDITADPELLERYCERVPVVMVGEEEAFSYRVNEKALIRMVRRGYVKRRFSFRSRRGDTL
jgi:glutaredoxin